MGGPRRPFVALVAAALTALPATASEAAEPEPFVAGLDLPVSMAFAPDGRLFVAEQHLGDIRVVEDGALVREPFAHIDVLGTFEQGLLGIALHPDFPDEPWLYAYYSDPVLRINRLARLPVDRAGEPEILLDLLTTERGYHNGGDLVFGADGMLYITVGEVHEPERAQDPADIGGKVLRLAPDGSVPDDNPFGPGNAAFSIGHRNSFGICLDPETGDLWETENGPTSDDEVNLLRAGGNYGWPEQLGPGGAERGFVDPVLDYPTQIVPTGCAVWDGDLYFGSYGDGVVRRLRLPVEEPVRDQAVAGLGEPILDLAVGPDAALYLATASGISRLAEPDPAAIPTDAPATPPAGGVGPTPPGASTWIAIAAAIAIALGLAVRLRAGRRGTR